LLRVDIASPQAGATGQGPRSLEAGADMQKRTKRGGEEGLKNRGPHGKRTAKKGRNRAFKSNINNTLGE